MCKTPDFSIKWGDLGELKNDMISSRLPVELELAVSFVHLQAHGIGKWIGRFHRSSSAPLLTINQTTLCICRAIETEGKRHFTNKHRLEIRTHARAHIFLSRVLQFIYRTKTWGRIRSVQYLRWFMVDLPLNGGGGKAYWQLLFSRSTSRRISNSKRMWWSSTSLTVVCCIEKKKKKTKKKKTKEKKHRKTADGSISLFSPFFFFSSILVSGCVDRRKKREERRRMSEKNRNESDHTLLT